MIRQLLGSALADLVPQPGGWATEALQTSTQRTMLGAAGLWQLAMIGAVLATPLPVPTAAVMIALHVLAALAVRLGDTGRLPPSALVCGLYAVGLVDYVIAQDITTALAFAACWLINLTSVLAAFVVPGRRAIVVVAAGAVALGVGLAVLLPHWGADFAVVVCVTQLAILAASRLGFPPLLAFARGVDADDEAVQRTHRTEALERATTQRLAEDTRLLHDTAVNTLGAIANGGAGVADTAQVRRRCIADLVAIEELRSARRDRAEEAADLLDLFALPGLPIRRSGLDDDALRAVARRLSPEVRRALLRIAREGVTNATKHSGADHVTIDVAEVGTSLRVSVHDGGRGFAGPVPAGRGLAGSVLARAAEHGIEAEVDSTPGVGTRVTARVDLVRHGSPQDLLETADDVERRVATLRRRAGLAWGAGVTGVGLLLGLMNPGHLGAAFPMLGAMAVAVVVGVRSHGALPRWITGVLVAAAPVTFLISALAVDLGRTGAVHWQALATTVPLVVLVSSSSGRRETVAALAAVGVAAGSVAVAVGVENRQAGVIVMLAGLIAIGVALAWERFQVAVVAIGVEAAVRDRQAFRVRLDIEVRAAASATYERWVQAGLDDAASLLRRIGEGGLEPGSPWVRRACAHEERYLRQLTGVDPGLVRLGPAALGLLAAARTAEVDLTLRLGGRDAPSPEVAAAIGRALRAAVDASPGGSALTVTAFPVEAGLSISLVGPTLRDHVDEIEDAAGLPIAYENLGDQTLVQLEIAI